MPDPFIASIHELDFSPRSAPFPSPADWRDQVLYELMVDRFDDHRIDPPPATSKTPHMAGPVDPANGLCFQGGTLKGIARRLDYLKDLGRMAVPTLYVVGAEDAGAPPDVMRAMAAATPGARLEVVPEAAHIANLDNASGFARAVAAFLGLA